VTVPLLVRRVHGWPEAVPQAGRLFALGRWGLAVNVVAVVWGTLTAVNMAWPRESVYGEGPWQRYSGVLYTAILLVVGIVYYGKIQRRKDVNSSAPTGDADDRLRAGDWGVTRRDEA
jgi:hypothetical protein